MEINSLKSIYQTPASVSAGGGLSKAGRSANANASQQAGAAASDTVDISQKASFQTKLNTEMKKAFQAQNSAAPSADRLSALKEQYAGDQCPVSSMDVSRAMLRGICGIDFA